ncbi:MAG: glycosyltransferase family 2 protein [Gaiellaceae bacterium]
MVTPVHNGARFLRECIDSVLAQTYDNWRYTIVDNKSTDETVEIAREFAARDPRISVSENNEFLPIMQNWNHALRQMPDDAKYCKVVHADDTLFPECLERMVEVSEQNPSVGIVTSYALWGREVRHLGVPYPQQVVNGHAICRATLEGRSYVFGSPSSLLLRADVVRNRSMFYNEDNLHADTEVCFDVLRTTDLAFVHQILTRTRIHDEAMSSFTERINSAHDGWLRILARYGPVYLDRAEYARQLRTKLGRYGVFLLKAVLKGKVRDARFRAHHRATFAYALQLSLRRNGDVAPPPLPVAGE